MNIRKLAIVIMALMLLVMAAPAAMAAESDSTWSKVKAAGSDLWGTVKEKAPGAWEKTKETASDLYGKAKEKAPEIKEKVKTGVNNAQEKISDFNQDQQDQFWEWFDGQTGGTTNTAPSTDDNHNPNGNPEYEPGPDQEPEYEPGPDASGASDNLNVEGIQSVQSDGEITLSIPQLLLFLVIAIVVIVGVVVGAIRLIDRIYDKRPLD